MVSALHGYNMDMPEIRMTVTKQLDELLDDAVKAGMFASKADVMRVCAVYFLKDLAAGEAKEDVRFKFKFDFVKQRGEQDVRASCLFRLI